MSSFQIIGVSAEPFRSLFDLSDADLAKVHARRVVASENPGFPCRASLVDAEVGEELLLLPYEHQPAPTPYRASGPIFLRRGARQRVLEPGHVPLYVRLRLISVRAYDLSDMIVGAEVCEGERVALAIERLFVDPGVRYIHLHNAKRGCFSCLVNRAETLRFAAAR